MERRRKISEGINNALQSIAGGRERTNILHKSELWTIAFLVRRIPPWISSDMLTALGLAGNMVVFLGLVLASYFNAWYLLLGPLGLMINWFGDSLDGRLAYFRKRPRKWYGFSLDIAADWTGIIFIGIGFMIYVDPLWNLLVYAFVALYGGSIIMAMLRYKITGKYSIDNGFLGPTEVRIALALILMAELLFRGSINYAGALASLALFVFNVVEFFRLLKLADARDRSEREKGEEDVQEDHHIQ